MWDSPHTSDRTRIKICGIQDPDMALVAADAGADAVGLVHHPASPRYVDPTTATDIRQALPPGVTVVDVVVDPQPQHLSQYPGWIQFHGDETTEDIASAAGPVIRGFSFDAAHVVKWDQCPQVSLLLVDGPGKGAGDPFDHHALAKLMPRLQTPLLLAGGLTPEVVGRAIEVVRPWGVDVSSGVESARGVKDAVLIRAFCEAVRRADEH